MPSRTQWSPAVEVPSAGRQSRFFHSAGRSSASDGETGDQQCASSAKGGIVAPSSSAIPLAAHQVEKIKSKFTIGLGGHEVQDGVDVDLLRILAAQALGTPSLSPLPSTAVFFGSLLYAKTESLQDCFLYAQSLARNGESMRCVRLLEKSGLLETPSLSLRLESVLLAAEALSVLGEWEGVLDLLEDAVQVGGRSYPKQSQLLGQSFQVGEDDDDSAWDCLFEAGEQPNNYIHPVSRLCLWRGQAYSETGQPHRAAIFWKKAIRMDPTCVQALDFLLTRSVVTPHEAYDVIKGLSIEASMEWLRDLYLARIDLSPQVSGDIAEAQQSTQSEVNIDSSKVGMFSSKMSAVLVGKHPPYLEDSSSQVASLSTTNTPRSNGERIFDDADYDVHDTKKHIEAGSNDGTPFTYDLTETTADSDRQVKKIPAKSPMKIQVDDAFARLLDVHKLHRSPEVLSLAARRAHRRYDLRGALERCLQLAAVDPLCQTAGLVYISTLTALGHKRDLFKIAHEWVEACPKSARAWFAVGSYYYACERYHVAQRHFCRATRLDPHCTEAWIAFGCSFAACDESDQALASFRTAQRLSPGEYASLLYMGMEYLRTNHLVLAQYFLISAFKASGGDPLCLNELGVLSIQKADYIGAIGWFSRALRACVQDELGKNYQRPVIECIELCQEPQWEATIFNLGQCFRKTRRLHEASVCFHRCVALAPERCSAYAALAFTKHLMGRLEEAINFYHQALGCRPDDPFSSEMLNKALQETLSTTLGEDDAIRVTAARCNSTG